MNVSKCPDSPKRTLPVQFSYYLLIFIWSRGQGICQLTVSPPRGIFLVPFKNMLMPGEDGHWWNLLMQKTNNAKHTFNHHTFSNLRLNWAKLISSPGFYSHNKKNLANVSLDTLRTCVQCNIDSVPLTDPWIMNFLHSLAHWKWHVQAKSCKSVDRRYVSVLEAATSQPNLRQISPKTGLVGKLISWKFDRHCSFWQIHQASGFYSIDNTWIFHIAICPENMSPKSL